MIEPFFASFTPLILISCAIAMVVLRAGASMVFFDIVGTFQAGRLIKDTSAAMTAFEGLMLDGLSNVEEAVLEVFRPFNELREATMPIAEDVELARIEFEKFVQTSSQAALGQEITEIGNAFGYTAEQSFQAGARMAQLATVMGEAALPAAVEASLAFGLIGEMEARDAQEKMISLMQQTQFIFKDVTKAEYALMDAQEQREHVTREMANTLNALNSIEDNSAAIMPQIVNAMNEFAGAGTLAGESLEYMAAMSAMLIERGVTAQKAGTSLRMAYARLGANINGAADAVEAYGVQVKDSNGNMRGMETILNELAPTYDNLAQGQRMALAQAIAGNRHYARIVFLMEDLNRVNQLATEGYSKSKPVMDEAGNAIEYLSNRLDTHHHKLQVARAELDKWQGALGEGFIPATTLATQRQADFYREVVLTTEALGNAVPWLDDVAGRILAMQQVAEKMFAPFVGAILNIKQLQVAIMTFQAIQRAVSGERIAYFDQETRGYGMAKEGQYSLNRLLGIYNAGLWDTVNAKKAAIIAEAALRFENAETYQTEWQALRLKRQGIVEMIRLRQVEARNAQNYAYMESLSEKILAQQAKKRYNEEQFTQQGLEKYRMRAADAERYLIRLKAEKARLQELNLHKLDREMQKVNALYEAERKRVAMLAGTAKVLSDSSGNMWLFDEAIDATSDDSGDMNWALTEMQSKLMGVSMGAMIATGFISMFGDMLWKGQDGAQAARIQMIAMTIASGAMMVQMTHSMTAMGGAAIASQNLAQANHNAANSYREIAAAAEGTTVAVASATAGIGATLKRVIWYAAIITTISWGIEKLFGYLGLWGSEDDLSSAYTPWTPSNNNTYFDTTSIDNWTASLEDASKEAYKFGNAREELFFGFRAGNVTGDLIKQIEQKGIENFVANTEIIQHNHFNGLTTDQVAGVILDAIESQGISRGMTF